MMVVQQQLENRTRKTGTLNIQGPGKWEQQRYIQESHHLGQVGPGRAGEPVRELTITQTPASSASLNTFLVLHVLLQNCHTSCQGTKSAAPLKSRLAWPTEPRRSGNVPVLPLSHRWPGSFCFHLHAMKRHNLASWSKRSHNENWGAWHTCEQYELAHPNMWAVPRIMQLHEWPQEQLLRQAQPTYRMNIN